MASYQGKRIVESSGPEDAEIIVVGESPADCESGTCRHRVNAHERFQPFVGPSGQYLNLALKRAALDRSKLYLMNLVPVQPDGNKFANHDKKTLAWGLAKFEEEIAALSPKLVVAAGGSALEHLTGLKGINQWRGSLIHPEHWPVVDLVDREGRHITHGHPATFVKNVDRRYIDHPAISERPWPVLATNHPAAILHGRDYSEEAKKAGKMSRGNFSLIWWLRLDFLRARKYIKGQWSYEYEDRDWNLTEDVDDFNRFVDRVCSEGHFVAIDTEQEPFWIVSVADELEVHSFAWSERFRVGLEKLLQSGSVLKTAHNLDHDWTFFHKRLGITPSRPFIDTMGLAHLLNPEWQKALSPACSTRYTHWPYHKWVRDYNPLAYCGLDTACSADIYWGAIPEIHQRKLAEVCAFDHRLMEALMEMQWRGVPVDEGARGEVEAELKGKLGEQEKELREIAEPVIRKRLRAFKKPHLFFKRIQCKCCNGAKRCWKCTGLEKAPKVKADYVRGIRSEDVRPNTLLALSYSDHREFKNIKLAELKRLMDHCFSCEATGKVDSWQEFNPDSPVQIADLIYRGLAIAPRKYMGKETVRYERLDAIKDRHPFLGAYVETQKVRSEADTVIRLRPGEDGRIHSVFDPFGTTSGRVASKEGLIEAGTNLMNLPYEARRLIVAEEGQFILYPDLEQVEARCVAVLSKDPKLLEIFASGKDSHMEVKDAIEAATGYDLNTVSVGPHAGAGRFFAKKLTYAFSYGIRATHLSGELGIPVNLATRLLKAMAATFPGIQRWKDKVAEEVFRTRSIKTPGLHERKFLDRIADSKTKELDYEILKKALSHAPQDMAARVLAEGMLEIREKWSELLTPYVHVHDAVVLMADLDKKHEAVEIATAAMSREKWGMKFPAGMSVGDNWLTASLSDEEKTKRGLEQWTLVNFLKQESSVSGMC